MNRKELYKWLDEQDFSLKKSHEMASVYFMVDGIPLYFMHYNGSYFESPCTLFTYEITEEELEEYVRESYEENYFDLALSYEQTMYRNGMHYIIENFQTAPWLQEINEIKMISEQECLDWLIENSK